MSSKKTISTHISDLHKYSWHYNVPIPEKPIIKWAQYNKLINKSNTNNNEVQGEITTNKRTTRGIAINSQSSKGKVARGSRYIGNPIKIVTSKARIGRTKILTGDELIRYSRENARSGILRERVRGCQFPNERTVLGDSGVMFEGIPIEYFEVDGIEYCLETRKRRVTLIGEIYG